jgi:hypothetical protein
MRLNKINKLSDGRQLFAYWANNAGRGDDNCTLVVVPAGTNRTPTSKPLCSGNFYSTEKNWMRTSSWKGNVNLSHAICKFLGFKKSDISL